MALAPAMGNFCAPGAIRSAPGVPNIQDRNAIETGVTTIEITRWFLALFFVGVAVFYTTRILCLKRIRGISPVFPGAPGTLQFATHLAFRLFRLLILLVCVGRLLWPPLDRYLVTFDILWHPVIIWLGNGMLLGGFIAVVMLHFFMGQHWRSGTRVTDTTRLITTGPYARSRNPMLLCVMVAQTGLFLALPSVFTLVCLLVGIWAVVA